MTVFVRAMMASMPTVRLPHPDLLAAPDTISRVVGKTADVTIEPISVPGFSGARFERVVVRLQGGGTRTLVLKRARFDSDWTAWRTADDFGRAALPLDEPALAGIWQAFACPFLAHAVADGEIGLLMEDLSPHLFPDVRQPLEEGQEDTLLRALAALHARFWNAPFLEDPRLSDATRFVGLLGPRLVHDETRSSPTLDRAQAGWKAALPHLPPATFERLSRPPEEVVRSWGDLPSTLFHGDVKVANFALAPGRGIAAFDWGLVGAGPPAIDLGLYLAVNASRIRGTKESFIARYRGHLETALGSRLPEPLWAALVDAAIETGAMVLLWSKALALESGGPAARDEWNWWIEHLEHSASRAAGR